MKLMTIWAAYHKAYEEYHSSLIIWHQAKRSRQVAKFYHAIEQHLEEWDEYVGGAGQWKEVTVQELLDLTDSEMADIEARLNE